MFSLEKVQSTSEYFFLSGLSFTGSDILKEIRESERATHVSFYHFHPLMNIRIFHASNASGMPNHIFNHNKCSYQTVTQ